MTEPTTMPPTLHEIEDVLLTFFEERGGLPGSMREQQLDVEYLTAGVITSVGVVELIMHVEQTFGISFRSQELQSPEFTTARGLATLIARHFEPGS